MKPLRPLSAPRPAGTLSLPLLVLLAGCSLFPETRHRDVVHNPFPQLKRVAVLPFFNQSDEPTVDTDEVAASYFAALQSFPGFEVLPVGVTRAQWMAYSMQYGEPRSGADFQRFAQGLGVDAVVVGSVTDFDAYYPPRLGLTVHWYAANPGFHPIPPGYGLPWGTDAEEEIPRRIVREAEFELARSQLKTQTPQRPANPDGVAGSAIRLAATDASEEAGQDAPAPLPPPIESDPESMSPPAAGSSVSDWSEGESSLPPGTPQADHWMLAEASGLPPDWPDPSDLIPDPPQPYPPVAVPTDEPVLSHTRLYRGDDAYFTERLADYVETGDDARPAGWQGYLSRSDDFIRFCCHLHITEMLESRGGREQSDLILTWPLSRY